MSGTMQRQQEPDITWTMSLTQARFILSILAKQPFETVAPVIRMLEEQATAQLNQMTPGNGQIPDSPHRQLPS